MDTSIAVLSPDLEGSPPPEELTETFRKTMDLSMLASTTRHEQKL